MPHVALVLLRYLSVAEADAVAVFRRTFLVLPILNLWA